MIAFERCNKERNPEKNCQEKDVIDNWMARKFIVTVVNTEVFSNGEFESDKKVQKQSQLVWNVLSPQMRMDVYNYVRQLRL